MRVFQEEIFGPVASVTTFKDEADAIAIANDTLYGLGAGVWTRDAHQLYQVPRAIKAGRVWVNCYHNYPGPRAIRRLQKNRLRTRKPQNDARPLPQQQKYVGFL